MIRKIIFVMLCCAIAYGVSAQDYSTTKFEKTKDSKVKTSSPVVVVFNESSKVINIAFREAVNHIDEITIYNIIGKDLYNIQMEKIGDKVFLIDAHDLKPGFYFLKIKAGPLEHIERITIKPGPDQFSVSSKAFIPTIS